MVLLCIDIEKIANKNNRLTVFRLRCWRCVSFVVDGFCIDLCNTKKLGLGLIKILQTIGTNR